MTAAQMNAAAFQRGIEAGRHYEREKFEIVIKMYDKALVDQSVIIPTSLQLALEHARSELAKQNIAAEVGIRKDQRERLEGKPDAQGLDVFGRSLEFGS